MINIDFSGKNVLLTGAGGGIGAGIARAYGKAGAHVHLADLKPEMLDAIVQEFKGAGYSCTTHAMNVTDEAMVGKVIDDIVAKDGKLDMLCNCAGINVQKPYMMITSEEFDRVLAVNLVGMHKVIQAALKHMLPRGEGKIVNIASDSTRKGTPIMAPYSASKFGVQSLTQSVALSVAEKGINVNAICPGLLETSMADELYEMMEDLQGVKKDQMRQALLSSIPLGHFQTPDDIGNAAVFLSSELAVNVTGQALNVNGGRNMN